MTLAKLRARLGEDGFVTFGRAQGGLIGGGPEFSRRHVAQIDKCSPAIARGILAPAGDRQIAPATVAAARAADRRHDSGRWTRGEPRASARSGLVKTRMTPSPSPRLGRDSSSSKSSGRTLAVGFRDALLQQQVGRFEQRTGHEAPLHRAVAQQIDQSQQAHPLVMRHERSDGDAGFVRRQARRRVIHRFVKSVSAFASLGREPLQVFASFPRRDHQRHRGGVRRDHQVLGQAPFQTQARHAKGAVLVVQCTSVRL